MSSNLKEYYVLIQKKDGKHKSEFMDEDMFGKKDLLTEMVVAKNQAFVKLLKEKPTTFDHELYFCVKVNANEADVQKYSKSTDKNDLGFSCRRDRWGEKTIPVNAVAQVMSDGTEITLQAIQRAAKNKAEEPKRGNILRAATYLAQTGINIAQTASDIKNKIIGNENTAPTSNRRNSKL